MWILLGAWSSVEAERLREPSRRVDGHHQNFSAALCRPISERGAVVVLPTPPPPQHTMTRRDRVSSARSSADDSDMVQAAGRQARDDAVDEQSRIVPREYDLRHLDEPRPLRVQRRDIFRFCGCAFEAALARSPCA
jgi:hypothetical protein